MNVPVSSAPAEASLAFGQAAVRPVAGSSATPAPCDPTHDEGGASVDGAPSDRPVARPLDGGGATLAGDPVVDGPALRAAVEAALDRLPFFGLMAPAGRTRGMLLQSIEAIPLPAPIAVNLTLARETRPELFEHGVLAATLCAHLVRESGAPIHDMTMAAAAGLLHDLGMLQIAPEMLQADKRLTGDERRPLYVHPMTASMLVARFPAYPKTVARAIFEHHEAMDGSGYPRGLAGDAISPLGRLLALTEVVTAMFDGHRRFPEQRISLLLRIGRKRFDPALVPSIQRLLRALPVPPIDGPQQDAAASVAQLQNLATLLAQWHEAVGRSAAELDSAGQAMLRSVAEQADTLQLMLHEAGITPEHLAMLPAGPAADPSLCVELWALGQELRWHLGAMAEQLQRRWRARTDQRPLPQALVAWLEEVSTATGAR